MEDQSKSLEDLEFQKLEREINQDEEKENKNQEVLREIAERQRLTVTRKVQSTESVVGMYHTAVITPMCSFLPEVSAVPIFRALILTRCQDRKCDVCYREARKILKTQDTQQVQNNGFMYIFIYFLLRLILLQVVHENIPAKL